MHFCDSSCVSFCVVTIQVPGHSETTDGRTFPARSGQAGEPGHDRSGRQRRRTSRPPKVLGYDDTSPGAAAAPELLAAERNAALGQAFCDLPPSGQRRILLLLEDPPVP